MEYDTEAVRDAAAGSVLVGVSVRWMLDQVSIAAERIKAGRDSLPEAVDWQGWDLMLVLAGAVGCDFVQAVGGGPSVGGAVAYTECSGGGQ